ncbi:hypothetical protein [Streptomyces sp. NPDC020965]|uniref:hypothetical protein n=1 Tax=Streptomyces sp. NPDC020965 TaxID=3365105 RepID=UPI0037B609A3
MNEVDPAPAADPAGAGATPETDPERTAAMPIIDGLGGPDRPGAARAAAPAPTHAPVIDPRTGQPARLGQPGDKPPSSDWFAPRKSGTNGAGIAVPGVGAADAPAAGTPSNDPAQAGQSAPAGATGFPPGTHGGPPVPGARPPGGQGGQNGPGGPGGRTAGPAQGTMPIRQQPGAPVRDDLGTGQGLPGAPGTPGGGPAAPGAPGHARAAGQGQTPGQGQRHAGQDQRGQGQGSQGQVPAKGHPQAPAHPQGPGQAQAPGHPQAPGQAATPGQGRPGGGAPRLSDDTAILTPQRPIPDPAAAPGAGGHVSGETLTSGIPVVPPEQRSPFPPQGGPGGPRAGADFPGGPGSGGPVISAPGESAAPAPAPAPAGRPAPPPAKKKGRSKLVLLGVGVVGLVGVAYGAGLLMNHSEVPKSTTVLGVDIGGGTKEQAVIKLQDAFGKRAAAPLRLAVGDKEEQLAPDKAGLSLDSQATVRGAAGSDYNPVSVIGSLFGGERVAEPVIVVDEEKLSVALTDLAGTSGSAVDGTIKFVPGKAVAVPGKSGQSLDVDQSMTAVKDAYRAQVETGKPNAIELPVATREPTITQAELDRAMKEFAEPAMSDGILIQAGGREIEFGPVRSLPRILSMKAIDGRLVEVYNKKEIEELLEGVFDGVMITKGDGKQHQLSAGDVAQAMRDALRGTTNDERTVKIDLNVQ